MYGYGSFPAFKKAVSNRDNLRISIFEAQILRYLKMFVEDMLQPNKGLHGK